jgi:hypothetical protein
MLVVMKMQMQRQMICLELAGSVVEEEEEVVKKMKKAVELL